MHLVRRLRFAVACLGAALLLGASNAQTAQELNTLRATAFAAENQGSFGAAADAFLSLAKAEPMRTEWAVAAGRCLGRSGRFKEAVELLDAARKNFPGIVELPAMLARTYLLQAEREGAAAYPEVLWTDAAELAREVLALDPDHEDSRLVLAQAQYLLGDWQDAVKQAEEAVRRHPQRAGAHVLIGRIATDRFRQLLQVHETTKPTGQDAADLVHEIDAERQLAKRSFRRAAELDPTRTHAHLALAQLAETDHRSDEARQHVLDALAIDPDVGVDHDRLTAGLEWQARRDLYRQLQNRYAAGTTGPAQPPKIATLRFYEGAAQYEGRDWVGAKDSFAAALAGNPAATNAHYYLFMCAYSLDDLDAAEQHAATYAALGAPAFADQLRRFNAERRGEVGAIVQFLAHRAFQNKRLRNSRDLNHVIACLKDSAEAWNNHAFLCRENGDYDAALSSYHHALDREPDSPQLCNDTGVVLQYHLPGPENLEKARGMYERAIGLADKVLADPRSSAAKRTSASEAKRNAEANLAELRR